DRRRRGGVRNARLPRRAHDRDSRIRAGVRDRRPPVGRCAPARARAAIRERRPPAVRAAPQSREYLFARLTMVQPLQRIHVLVADDEPHIGRIIKMKLEQGPFDVTLAYDGREALDDMASDPDIALVV